MVTPGHFAPSRLPPRSASQGPAVLSTPGVGGGVSAAKEGKMARVEPYSQRTVISKTRHSSLLDLLDPWLFRREGHFAEALWP